MQWQESEAVIPRRSVTLIVTDIKESVIDALYDQLTRSHIEVRVVSDRTHDTCQSRYPTFVTQRGECLWEIIPPCDLVVCTNRVQEEEVRVNTGFPYITVSEVSHAHEEIIGALQSIPTRREGFRKSMLSVCMIAKDEERNIGRALRSVCGVAGEIVVVDTGSSDATPEIARQYGAKVFSFPWIDDFSAARNESLSHATGDWILVLDADEAISKEFRHTVLKILQEGHDVEAYSMPLINVVSGKPKDRSQVLRLFRNRKTYRFEGRVHEQIGPSILRSGGQIRYLNIPIFHYGYTAADDFRKGRRQRNRRLLERAYREDPARVDYWYHLGYEALIVQDLKNAEFWFRKVLVEAPTHPFAALSAPLLAKTLEQLGRYQDAWAVASAGTSTLRGRGKSLVALAELALREGDFITAEWCARALQHLPSDAEGPVFPARVADQLLAGCLLEQGRRREALKSGEKLLRCNPEDIALAFWYARLVERAKGVRSASVEAIRRFGTVAVKAAALQPLVHAGEWDLAAKLAEVTGSVIQSPYHVVSYLHAGAQKAAVDMAERLGVEGCTVLILWGLERNDDALLRAGLSEDIPSSHYEVVRHIQEGTSVSAALDWVLPVWMRLAAELRMDRLFRQLATHLPGGAAAQNAKAALILYEIGRKQEALKLALESPSEPEALQVLGLAAYENRDWEAAATFLQARAAFGDAPVRVYWWGSLALRQLGKVRDAEALLEAGRKARPLSKLLADPPRGN